MFCFDVRRSFFGGLVMLRFAMLSVLSLCSVAAAQSPLVVNHYVPSLAGEPYVHGSTGVYTDIPASVRTMTVPKGRAIINWSFNYGASCDPALIRPRIGTLAPNEGLPQYFQGTIRPSGSWATPVDAGEISVALQLGFLSGSDCYLDAGSFITWTLIVFPDTSGGVPAVGGVGLAMMVVAMLAAGGYIIRRRQVGPAA